jgi:radical S-adenosyl methionine domain-containing protein 2
MQKINFSGGEPFIVNAGKFVGEMARFCKEELHLPSVTIVSNGSLIKEHHLRNYGVCVCVCVCVCA